MGFARNDVDVSRERALKALSDFLRPEFISRVDEIIVFRQLTEDDFEKIAHLMLDEYVSTLKDRGTKFIYDEKATRWLAQHAIGGKSGARDLRNLIRKKVEDQIASVLVENGTDSLAGIAVTADDENGIQMQVLQ